MLHDEYALHKSRALSFGILDDLFPGKCGLQDIDASGFFGWGQDVVGTTEYNGKFLYLELKPPSIPLKRGQAIYWHRRVGKDRGDSACFVLESKSQSRVATLDSVLSFWVIYSVGGRVVRTSPLPAGLLGSWVCAWRDFARSGSQDFNRKINSESLFQFVEGEK